MEEKSSLARLFYKRAKKPKKKQISFIFDSRSPQLPPSTPAQPIPKNTNAYHFVDSLAPKYGSAKKGNCLTCGTTTSTQWRRGPAGAETLCNSCGLRWKKVQKREDKLDNTPIIETRLEAKKTKESGLSHHFLLQPLKTSPSARKVETTDAVEPQQHQNDDQNESLPKEQPKDKLSISFLLN